MKNIDSPVFVAFRVNLQNKQQQLFIQALVYNCTCRKKTPESIIVRQRIQ